mmetsp:Transcript_12538/g.31329  ORF Transcript_12538/g.31329 Transcript_12538/m.31329 type:complete len:329 (-) Transcript_12538:610-1596(-)
MELQSSETSAGGVDSGYLELLGGEAAQDILHHPVTPAGATNLRQPMQIQLQLLLQSPEDAPLPHLDERAQELPQAPSDEQLLGLMQHEDVPKDRVVNRTSTLALCHAACRDIQGIAASLVLQCRLPGRTVDHCGPTVWRLDSWNVLIVVGGDAEQVHRLAKPAVHSADVTASLASVPQLGEVKDVVLQLCDLVALQREAIVDAVASSLSPPDLVEKLLETVEERGPQRSLEVRPRHAGGHGNQPLGRGAGHKPKPCEAVRELRLGKLVASATDRVVCLCRQCQSPAGASLADRTGFVLLVWTASISESGHLVRVRTLVVGEGVEPLVI